MLLKRMVIILICALFCIVFSGCENLDMDDAYNLLASPKLEGDMYPIQQALEKAVGGNFTFKYPAAGDYRSALILKDLDADGENEAVAFYSTTVETVITLHINIIDGGEEEWQSKGDMSLVGNGVESVSFADLDSDGKPEILVGWMLYGTAEKQLGVYSFDGKQLSQRVMEPYTDFLCADLTGDEKNELSVIYLNVAEQKASAKVFSLVSKGVKELGTVPLDGGVTSYFKPVLSTLENKTPALYIDAAKGTGMLTEIIWFEDKVLRSAFDPERPEASLTYRDSAISSRDFNGDGIIDIPLMELLSSTEDLVENDKVYYTNWSVFDGQQINTLCHTFMNYTDGYYITVDSQIKERLYLTRKTESRLRTFFGYDPETGLAVDELFRLVTVSAPDYDSGSNVPAGYVVIERTDKLVYLAKITENNSLMITQETLENMFNLIN